VGDEGAAEAAKLLAVPDSAPPTAGVVTLDLTKNLIGEVGGLAIASALVGNCCLTELMLSQNPIGDETAKALALAIVGNEDSAVRRLNLSQCSLGDVGATALAEALETEGGTEFGTHINALYLGRNAISDVGAAQLADALEDSINLKELYLGGCKM
jgi:Ran GTPase-activating protein (RanGAP) involved in mRNA processing and transport